MGNSRSTAWQGAKSEYHQPSIAAQCNCEQLHSYALLVHFARLLRVKTTADASPVRCEDDASGDFDDPTARTLFDQHKRPHVTRSQIHLALTGNQTEMRISWKTTHAGCPNKVHYDVTPDYLTASAANDNDDDANATIVSAQGGFADGTTVSYSSNDMCGAPARSYKSTPLFFQSSVLTGLVPGQRYYYRLHGDKHVYSFRAPPKVGPHVHTSFLAYGDMGESTHKAAKAPGCDLR